VPVYAVMLGASNKIPNGFPQNAFDTKPAL
jgi:hypothetical protein